MRAYSYLVYVSFFTHIIVRISCYVKMFHFEKTQKQPLSSSLTIQGKAS